MQLVSDAARRETMCSLLPCAGQALLFSLSKQSFLQTVRRGCLKTPCHYERCEGSHSPGSGNGYPRESSTLRCSEWRNGNGFETAPSAYLKSLNRSSMTCCMAAFRLFSMMAVICAISQSCYFFSRFLRSSSRLLISFSPPLESAHSLERLAALPLLPPVAQLLLE